MKAVVQRVAEARVSVAGETVGEVGPGLLVLLGVAAGDGAAEAEFLAGKIARLRVFADEAGKMNRSLVDLRGGLLAVSQFTLCADTSRGNRPGFSGAAPPEDAERLYRRFCAALEALGVTVARGRFGADMQVALVNDGPVTICFDTAAR
ncbi:MAG: D-aminoacyl-tRNA deacylase [Rhodospirillales bacterium]|nr:D-aminoacyl-tRNA deacylase [Rhodospirillales bacterium]